MSRRLSFIFTGLILLLSSCNAELLQEVPPIEYDESQDIPKFDLSPKTQGFSLTRTVGKEEVMIQLSYDDENLDLATDCTVSDEENIIKTSPCSCDSQGKCSVGVKSVANFNGKAKFLFMVIANSEPSDVSEVKLTVKNDKSECPKGYVYIKANPSVKQFSDFCVMKFEAKCNKPDGTTCNNRMDKPVSTPQGTPWVEIAADESFGGGSGAHARCRSIKSLDPRFKGSFSLISNPEYMAIARELLEQPSNWHDNIIDSKFIRGHSDGSSGLLEVLDETDPYDGTGENALSPKDSGWEQRRQFFLESGESLWDFSGNSSSWVNFKKDEKSYSPAPRGCVDHNFNPGPHPFNIFPRYCSPYLNPSDFVPGTSNSFTKNLGVWLGGHGNAVNRGGGYNYQSAAGIFSINLKTNGSVPVPTVGFRCVYNLE